MHLQQFPFTGTRKLTVTISEFICNYNQMHIATFQILRHYNSYRSGIHSVTSITVTQWSFFGAYFISRHADLYATSDNSPIVKWRRFHMNKNTYFLLWLSSVLETWDIYEPSKVIRISWLTHSLSTRQRKFTQIRMAYLQINTQMTFHTIPHFKYFVCTSISVGAFAKQVEQDRQCTDNLALRRIRAIIVAVKKSNKYYIFLVCVWSIRYLAGNAHALYCRTLPVQLYSIFPHYLINGTIYEGKNLSNIYIYIYFTTFVSTVSHYINLARYDQNVYCEVPVSLDQF